MAVTALALASCSTSTPPTDALAQGTGATWILDRDPTVQTVSLAWPDHPVALPAAGTLDLAVRSFLDRYKSEFGMETPLADFALANTTSDDAGFQYLRYGQQSRGVPVVPGGLTVTVDPSGRLALFAGLFVPATGAIDITPSQTPEQASAVAAASSTSANVLSVSDGEGARVTGPMIYAGDAAVPVLAFQVDAAGMEYFVDAHTGSIADSFSTLMQAEASGYGSLHYPPFSGGSVLTFPVSDDTPPVLRATTQGGVTVGSFQASLDDENVNVQAATLISGTSLTAWTDSSTPTGVAVDCQFDLTTIVDTFQSLFGWSSWDGKGSPVGAYVVDHQSDTNAAWYPGGSGVIVGPAHQANWDLATNPDPTLPLYYPIDGVPTLPLVWASASSDIGVIAHEFTHGISRTVWNGVATPTEAGAIDEAMSDIVAMLIGPELNAGHLCGAGSCVFEPTIDSAAFARDLAAPHRKGAYPVPTCDSIDEYRACSTTLGGVPYEPHLGSTIASYAFYLMTFGGTHEVSGRQVLCPLGIASSRKLWWTVESKMMPQRPTFRTLAQTTIATAELLGLDPQPVACAWSAVRVLNEADLAAERIVCPTVDGGIPPSSASGGSPLVNGPSSLLCPQQAAAPR